MPYCKVTKKEVYSCDHHQCNEGRSELNDPRHHQGMTYCYVVGSWVYGCDHYKCKN